MHPVWGGAESPEGDGGWGHVCRGRRRVCHTVRLHTSAGGAPLCVVDAVLSPPHPQTPPVMFVLGQPPYRPPAPKTQDPKTPCAHGILHIYQMDHGFRHIRSRGRGGKALVLSNRLYLPFLTGPSMPESPFFWCTSTRPFSRGRWCWGMWRHKIVGSGGGGRVAVGA